MNHRLIPNVPDPVAASTLAAAIVIGLSTLGGCAGLSDPTGLLGSSKPASDSNSAPTPTAAGQSLPAERLAEDGPTAPTAVVEESFTLDGVILPVTRGQSRVETRSDRRRTDSAVTFDNWLMRRLAPDGQTADIVRVDRHLVWTLVPARREYTECPIGGCRTGSAETPQSPPQQEQQRAPDCPVKLTANDLEVQPTGEKRTVNGFATERYRIGWLVQLSDEAGRSVRNQVDLDLWTTPETGPVREVQSVTDAFNRRYASALAATDSPVARFLPKHVTAAMSSLMRNIDGKDRQTMARWDAELKKLRGYPIATTMTWTADGTVCGAAGQPTAASLGGMLGSMMGGRRSEAGAKPLVTFNHEVRSLAIKPVADAVFSPPGGYRRTN